MHRKRIGEAKGKQSRIPTLKYTTAPAPMQSPAYPQTEGTAGGSVGESYYSAQSVYPIVVPGSGRSERDPKGKTRNRASSLAAVQANP